MAHDYHYIKASEDDAVIRQIIRRQNKISERTKRKLKKKKYKPVKSKKQRYTNVAVYDRGFSMLQYWGTVRKFIEVQYSVTTSELELLLYLFPIGYFTQTDIRKGSNLRGDRLAQFIRRDFFMDLSPELKTGKVYKLTIKGENIVMITHKFLSGEKKIPITPMKNKIFQKDAPTVLKYARTLMRELNEAEDNEY